MRPKIGFISDRLNLRLALLIYVVAPLAVSVAVSGYLALGVIERQVEARMKQDLELVARAIQLPLSHALERDRKGSVVSALQSAFSIGRVYSAYVYDGQGRQIASAGHTDPDPQRSKLTELAAERRMKGEYGRLGDRGVYSYFIPLTDSGGRVSGLLHLTRRESDFRQDIRTIRRQAFLWLSIGVLVMTTMVLFGHHQALGRHFRRLTNVMAEIAKGRHSSRIPPKGPKEIVKVADSFNHMLDSMQSAERALHRKRLEQRDLEKQLRHSEKLAAIGQLAAGVAHELGTPLSVISGLAQRGLRSPKLDPKLTANLQQIRDEVSRMTYIVRQLLEFSHRGQLQYKPVRPQQVACSAASAIAEEAESLKATVRVEAQGSLPAVKADPLRLEQGLVNMLRNAIQVGKAPQVRLKCKSVPRWIIFQVEDDGPGIPPALRPRVFEPFFTTKSVGAGTGLGLAVVHGIVQEHGGKIEVADSDMGGAMVRMWIPLRAADAEKAP